MKKIGITLSAIMFAALIGVSSFTYSIDRLNQTSAQNSQDANTALFDNFGHNAG